MLLLDEPFTALDPETADGMREVVAAACVGVTCVLVTHNAVDAAALATRIAVIEDGRRTQSGPVREVLQAPATPFAASFAGVNRLVGRAAGGRWIGDGLRVAGAEAAGVADGARLIAVFAPSAMRLTRLPPDGSGTNGSDGVDAAGVCTVTRVQGTPSGARVHLDAPGLFADVPLAEVAQGDLRPGVRVAVRIDARAVSLLPG